MGWETCSFATVLSLGPLRRTQDLLLLFLNATRIDLSLSAMNRHFPLARRFIFRTWIWLGVITIFFISFLIIIRFACRLVFSRTSLIRTFFILTFSGTVPAASASDFLPLFQCFYFFDGLLFPILVHFLEPRSFFVFSDSASLGKAVLVSQGSSASGGPVLSFNC